MDTCDKYTALWVSHTTINDFLVCPRAYYLKNIYKDPKTGHKIKLITPPLALGQIIHEVIEQISFCKTEDRFKKSLVIRLHEIWDKISGKKGGFVDSQKEAVYKTRAEQILLSIMKDPGPLTKKAVKIKMTLPYYCVSPRDNIILCGKIDWLEYVEANDTVHIIDFKTSKSDEKIDSFQLPIYYLLVRNCQRRSVSKVSYWYLERSDGFIEKDLPDPKKAEDTILEIAKKIKLARQLNRFKCPHHGCFACKPYEAIIQGNAEYVGIDERNNDMYILDTVTEENKKESEIL